MFVLAMPALGITRYQPSRSIMEIICRTFICAAALPPSTVAHVHTDIFGKMTDDLAEFFAITRGSVEVELKLTDQ